MKSIVVIANEKEFFFSTNHWQRHGMGPDFIPATHHIPCTVVPRPGLEDGIIRNKEDLIKVFYIGMREIANPNKDFQV